MSTVLLHSIIIVNFVLTFEGRHLAKSLYQHEGELLQGAVIHSASFVLQKIQAISVNLGDFHLMPHNLTYLPHAVIGTYLPSCR